MIAVVNQPTYLPWIGYFAMMDKADTFVFYDDVQLSVQSWQQRNRIKTGNGVQWLTIPIVREQGQRICDVAINYNTDWRKDHWETIKQAYSKAPYFKLYAPYIEEIYRVKWFLLSDYTVYIVRIMAMLLDIKMPSTYTSSAIFTTGSKTDRLISLLKNIGATEYVSGLAAKKYIEPEKFDKAGIDLKWFDYEHPVYPQIRDGFVAYLSAIDLLFNTGDKAIEFIRNQV